VREDAVPWLAMTADPWLAMTTDPWCALGAGQKKDGSEENILWIGDC